MFNNKPNTMTFFKEVELMAHKLMNTHFIYNGISYNMFNKNWKFEFNNNKTRLGLCKSSRISRRGTIYLSAWLIKNSNTTIEVWKNTMLHEIAHAIDIDLRGKSDHSYKWRDIALHIGCDGKRCGNAKVDGTKVDTKYTLICDACGIKRPSHKKRKRECSCPCNPNKGFDRNYLLRQIRNY
jgi:hypothetical protein